MGVWYGLLEYVWQLFYSIMSCLTLSIGELVTVLSFCWHQFEQCFRIIISGWRQCQLNNCLKLYFIELQLNWHLPWTNEISMNFPHLTRSSQTGDTWLVWYRFSWVKAIMLCQSQTSLVAPGLQKYLLLIVVGRLLSASDLSWRSLISLNVWRSAGELGHRWLVRCDVQRGMSGRQGLVCYSGCGFKCLLKKGFLYL